MTSPQETGGAGRRGHADTTPDADRAGAVRADPDRRNTDTPTGDTRTSDSRSGDGADSDIDAQAAVLTDRQSVVSREKDRYGGIKWGSAFFGWLTATGTAVILTALLVAAGTAVGVATDTDPADVQGQVSQQAGTIGLVGGIALLAVLVVAYYCGGYVAGRMARFNGIKQGVAVWVWAVVIAVLVAVAGAVLGDRYDVLGELGGFPRLPIGGDATTAGVIAIVIALVAALLGAILGGLAGMRFHRNVDKAGLGR
jgi:hypothetical protein